MLVDFEYLFCVNLLALKFKRHIINIYVISQKKIHGKKNVLNPWEGVKVVSNEKKFTTTHVGRF